WAVTDLDSYLRLVEPARPGDLFWVHALEQLVAQGYPHSRMPRGRQTSTHPQMHSVGEALGKMAAYLGESRTTSVVPVWRSSTRLVRLAACAASLTHISQPHASRL